jgi:hypothetical protein
VQQQQQLLGNLRSCKTHAFEHCKKKKQVEEEEEEEEEEGDEQESSPNLSLQLICRASNRPRSK